MRLFTRNNMDGVVAAALIMKKEPTIQDVLFAHPKDMQDGNVDVQPGDAITNLPFHQNANLWFDNHTAAGIPVPDGIRGEVKDAPSASRVVHDYYSFHEDRNYGRIHDMLHYTDRVDAAILTFGDVLNPFGWILLGFMLDPTTGLDLPEELYRRIIYSIRDGLTIEDILSLEPVRVAKRRYFAEEETTKILLAANSRLHGEVLVNDLRDNNDPLIGNRFSIYAIFPRCNVSVRIKPHDVDLTSCVISVGKSIYRKTLNLHLGKLMAEYGGGGLDGAGSCRVARNQVDVTLDALLERLV